MVRWSEAEAELHFIRKKEREKVSRKPDTVTLAEMKRENNRAKHELNLAIERGAVIKLTNQLNPYGIPPPESQIENIIPGRKFRFDLGWPDKKILVEIDGGTRAQGRHNRHSGFENDMVKTNEVAILGWTVLRVTHGMVHDGRAADQIRRAYESKGT